MTPHTVHRIAQQIRHERALLTVQETWAQQQEKSDTRDEIFRYVTFMRKVWKAAEHLLAQS